MTLLYFHSNELFYIRETFKARHVRINTLKDFYYNISFKCIWLPASRTNVFEKRYLTNGEMIHLLDIPNWLIDEHGLWDFYYRDPLDFVSKVDNIVAVRTSRTTTIEMNHRTNGVVGSTQFDLTRKLKNLKIELLDRKDHGKQYRKIQEW